MASSASTWLPFGSTTVVVGNCGWLELAAGWYAGPAQPRSSATAIWAANSRSGTREIEGFARPSDGSGTATAGSPST